MVSAMSRAARYSQALRPKPGSPWSKRSRAALRWAEFMDLYRSLLQLLPCPVCSATQSPGAMSRRPCHLEHASDVIRGDDAGIARLGGDRQHLGTGRDHALGLLVGDGVQHHAATHEAKFTRMLDAQRTHADHAAARAVLVGVPGDHVVVHHRALRRVHADVTRTVELRLDLADLRGH